MSLKAFFFGDNDYGFIKDDIKPGKTLINNNMKFVCTNDFKDHANNHCAATLLTNLCIYYFYKGYKGLLEKDTKETFFKIHKYVPDGPIIFLDTKAKRYFKDKGYKLEANKLNNLEDIKKSIDDGNPCPLLLENALFNWHWVLAIGYKDNLIEIIDNWHKTPYYYSLNKKSRLINAKSYSIKSM